MLAPFRQLLEKSQPAQAVLMQRRPLLLHLLSLRSTVDGRERQTKEQAVAERHGAGFVDAGAFIGPVGPGSGETGAGNKSELYRGYLQWAGWTIGEADSIWSLGNFKDGDIANVVNTDKSSGWTVYYTWTPPGPGVPPVKGIYAGNAEHTMKVKVHITRTH